MNKKKLSVVMAGAMLATSVAPVLAAETTMPASQLDLLLKNLETKMNSEKVSEDTRVYFMLGKTAPTNESVYGIQLLDSKGNIVKLSTKDINFGLEATTGAIDSLKTKLAGISNLEGYTIKVYERDHETFLGENILYTVPVEDTDRNTYYSNEDIEKIAKAIDGVGFDGEELTQDLTGTSKYPGLVTNGNLNTYIKEGSAVLSKDAGKYTVTFELQALENGTNRTITLSTGSQTLHFNRVVDSNNELLKAVDASNVAEDIQKCNGFLTNSYYKTVTELTGDPVEISSTKLTVDADDTTVSYKASDLYDGFALTAGATEIISDIANEKYTIKYFINESASETNKNNVVDTIALNSNTGIASINIEVSSSKGTLLKEYSITSTNAKELQSLMKLLLKGDFNVGIIGGNNRYETAVNVAKAQGITTLASGYYQNIVLVNGTSLVDGLAAAPLAASKLCTVKSGEAGKNAPVLLTESDKLSSATKSYIEELTENIAPSSRKDITINLVGGKSVLTTSLVNELEDMGFTVKRFGGDDREETSLKVAKEIGLSTDKEAFVVGANGEADAMSIASVAVEKKAPIIVSSVHGLTEDAVDYLASFNDGKSAKNEAKVTIVGGESVVSKAEETNLDESLEGVVNRLAGDNRFETNAKVIKEYYKASAIAGSTGVVLVKDGQSNKSELVDALSAANYAATMNAPIVLASSKVSDVQKNALLNVNGTVAKIAQVGIGAERTVLETIADLFDVSNL